MLTKLKRKLGTDKHFIELLKGSSISFVFRIIGMILGYVFTLMIARGYGADAMGIYSLSLTVLGMAVLVGKLGFDTALLKFVAEFTAKKREQDIRILYRKIMNVSIPFSIVIATVTYFASSFIAESFFHKQYLTVYFQIASLGIVPLVLLSINREAIRGLKNIKLYSFLTNIAVSLFATVCLAIFYFYSQDKAMPLIANIVAVFLACILSFIFWFKQYDKKHKSNVTIEKLKYKNIFSVSFPMLITASMTTVMGMTDIIMLGMYSTETDIGIYGVTMKIAMITSISLIAINTIAAPKFAEFWGRDDMDGLSKIVQQTTKMIFWSSFPILMFIFIFPGGLLSIFGKEFIIGATALMILTFGQFVNAISGPVGNIMNMTGYQKILQYTAITSAIINIILNYILIPKYGVSGAAIATATSGILWNILCVSFLYKKLHIVTMYIPFRRYI